MNQIVFQIDQNFISKIKKEFKNINLSKSYSGEGIVISKDNAKGVILKGIDKNEKNNVEFFDKFLIDGILSDFNSNNVIIGSELAFNLNLKIGDTLI